MNSPAGNISNVTVIILAHHTRQHKLAALRKAVHPLPVLVQMDNANHGSTWNHRQGINLAIKNNVTPIFMEDDAEPVPGFAGKALEWIEKMPNNLISFYLGTGRPPQFQGHIKSRIAEGAELISFGTLIHGVCYTIPAKHLLRIAARIHSNLPADYAVGAAWGNMVVYPVRSLVDHADEMPVEMVRRDNEPRNERRRAWMLDNR